MIDPAMTDEQLLRAEAILRALNDERFVGRDERRKQPRYVFRSTTQLRLVDDDAHGPIKAFTRNLSPTGVGVIVGHPFEVGQRFTIRLAVGGSGERLCVCRATFVRPVIRGICEVGAVFEHVESAGPAKGAAAGNTHAVAGHPLNSFLIL